MYKQFPALTRREMDVLMTICGGLTRKDEIAKELKISEPTVRTHINNIYSKVEVASMATLVLFVINSPPLRSICFPWLKVSERL